MRFVIKIGTSLLTTPDHKLDQGFLQRVIGDVAEIKKQGHEVILVSSGAVAAGRSEMQFEKEKKNIPYRQALAAIGQGVLMKTYHDLFARHDIAVAQALLTNYDFTNRGNFLNTKNVFALLLEKGAIPVVNENDVTTIAELKFGDNDMLSAKTAAMVSADFLIILTDVDGLFLEDPKNNPNAKLVPVVEKVDESVKKLAGGARSKSSLGGMVTKLEAAEYVTSVGIHMFIAGGRRDGILRKIVAFCAKKDMLRQAQHDIVGTFFPSSVNRLASQKKWLKPKLQKNAWIEIDAGAQKALTEMGKSLLPKGVVGVHGDFHRGDVVMVKCGGQDMGYGQVNYSSEEIDKIKKHNSDEIEQLLGFSFEEELIHRDRMVILH